MINTTLKILDLTCSIVLYKTDRKELLNVLTCLLATKLQIRVFLVDNSPTSVLSDVAEIDNRIEYIFNNANLGYGAAHNIAIIRAKNIGKYHLILNADVEFETQILEKAYEYMQNNDDVGLLSPKVNSPEGELLFFCRMLPTPFDLFARRFLPSFVKSIFKEKLENYLMLYSDYSRPMNIPNLSGCFMFTRTSALIKVDGFDENFFMYVEDVDLTRRLFQFTKCVYYPEISIVHGLARGSAKFSMLMVYHIKSAVYYFTKWGWFGDKERRVINSKLLKEYSNRQMDNGTIKNEFSPTKEAILHTEELI